MKSLLFPGVALFLAVSVLALGCTQPASAPAPTSASAAPVKAAEPAKPAEPTKAAAPAPQPTTAAAAPVKKVDYPQKGKTIQFILPSAAGSGADLGFRMFFSLAEKELGTNIEVVNKTGGGSQVGTQALASARPDGYSIGATPLPTTISLYLEVARKAEFNGASFIPIVMHIFDPGATAVKADSPYKSMKDLIDAAKANPGKIKMGVSGLKSRQHLDILQLQQMAGVKFANVHAASETNPIAMMLGGQLDAMQESVADFRSQMKSGNVRLLAVWDDKESPLAPGVPTLASQGYKVNSGVSRGISAPAGTQKEYIDILAAAFKKVMDSDEHKKKLDEMGLIQRYMGPAEYAAYWKETEARIKPLMDLPD